jgi:hypothetical protein
MSLQFTEDSLLYTEDLIPHQSLKSAQIQVQTNYT